jgi:phosphopantetheine adenylyltransferase
VCPDYLQTFDPIDSGHINIHKKNVWGVFHNQTDKVFTAFCMNNNGFWKYMFTGGFEKFKLFKIIIHK